MPLKQNTVNLQSFTQENENKIDRKKAIIDRKQPLMKV